jgi:hypothetical protein
MRRERELERRLREAEVPGEAEAEERSWEIVRAAYADRTPVRPTYRARRLALALAAGALLLAIGLSPAGAKVGDWVRDVVGEEDAKPALRSLPAAGELLVDSEQGPWIVREDGSKRLLGDYGEATWSPRGLFVAAANGRELVAIDPLGNLRWTVPAPDSVHDPRWSPSGYRIAYLSGDDLWVVAGDGTAEKVVARNVADVAPAWRPIGDSKVADAPGGVGGHVLTYVDGAKKIRTVDVDSGESVRGTPRDLELLSTPPSGGTGKRATSPDGNYLATLRRIGHRDELVLQRDGAAGEEVLFSARGELTGPTWSPDGHWLLVGWPQADQWLFIRTDQPNKVDAFDRVSEQFDPGDSDGAGFPTVSGWVLPER